MEIDDDIVEMVFSNKIMSMPLIFKLNVSYKPFYESILREPLSQNRFGHHAQSDIGSFF